MIFMTFFKYFNSLDLLKTLSAPLSPFYNDPMIVRLRSAPSPFCTVSSFNGKNQMEGVMNVFSLMLLLIFSFVSRRRKASKHG